MTRSSQAMLSWCVALTGALSLAALPSSTDQYSIEPAPAWVARVAAPAAAAAATPDRRVDVQQLLVDEQDRYGDKGLERYRHYALHILTAEGVSNASEIIVEFDQGYQKLALHHVRVLRGGATSDALARSQIRTVSAQPDRDARIYDDTLAVHILLTDIRVGDTVEYAYTRTGNNPTVRGHVLSQFQLARPTSIGHLEQRVSILEPSDPGVKVHGSALSPRRRSSNGFTEYTWSADNVPAVEVEDRTPRWFNPYPTVEVSDFSTWGDVVKWAAPLYNKPETLDPELDARVNEWKKEPEPERRLTHAIRFVQDEVRYLGIEVGPNSLEPHAPASVVAQRFGDCKDKSLLLVTLLRRLGIDAYPALVSTSRGGFVADALPSPYVFDHAIVRARIGQRTYFFDPTLTYQRGTAEMLRAPDYGWALVIAPESQALEKLGSAPPSEPFVETVDTYRLHGSDPGVALRVETAFRGNEAATSRQMLESSGGAQVQRFYENFYAKIFPTVTVAAPIQRLDDEAHDTLKLVEEYRIQSFWGENGAQTIFPWSIQGRLSKPLIVKRIHPLAIQHPLFVRHTIVVDWDPSVHYSVEPLSLDGAALSFRRTGLVSRGRLTLTYELKTLKDHLLPSEVSAHLALIDRIFEEAGYELARSSALTHDPTWTTLGVQIGAAVMGGFFLAFCVVYVRSTRRRRLFQRPPAKGVTAGSAHSVSSKADALRAMAAARCACGAQSPSVAAEPSETVRFGDRRLTIIAARCNRCGARVVRYFDVSSS